ncbi:hypothetical protein M378DRAFT_48092, partial [Amanita muscaria Koide BX008]
QRSLVESRLNSVIQSGFEIEIKRHWLGKEWLPRGFVVHDIHAMNRQTFRLEYRHQT